MTALAPTPWRALRDRLNFLLCNRIPRSLCTRLMGRFSRIDSPRLTAICLAVWRRFADLQLDEAKESRFRSLRAVFTRELKEGARSVDRHPRHLISPCDALIGARGTIEAGAVLQAKGSSYALAELLQDADLARYYEGGEYLTLRLTASMYHRFHAPARCRVREVTYVCGDAWNVNPPALARIERLFCRNERAIIRCQLAGGEMVTLVAVAAVLVASIRLTFIDVLLHLKYRGPNRLPCNASLQKGEQMGWFEHGSTIIVLLPRGAVSCVPCGAGARIKMGQALARWEAASGL